MRVNLVYDRRTIQGEGLFAGTRCTFVRLWGCNLACAWCDSAETWDTKGANGIVYPRASNMREMSANDIARDVLDRDVDVCVITGGEPLIQGDELGDLVRILSGQRVAVHIETNGTRYPSDTVRRHAEHFTVSPKLPSAKAGPAERCVNVDVLRGFARLGWQRATFKVVCVGPDDLTVARDLFDEVGVQRRARWVMPEGVEADSVDAGMSVLVEQAVEMGFSVSPRLHVTLWGTERGR